MLAGRRIHGTGETHLSWTDGLPHVSVRKAASDKAVRDSWHALGGGPSIGSFDFYGSVHRPENSTSGTWEESIPTATGACLGYGIKRRCWGIF